MNILKNFQINIRMIEAMGRYRQEPTKENKKAFFKELRTASFLVPCRQNGADMAVLQTKQGEGFLTAFSQLEEIQEKNFYAEALTVLPLIRLYHVLIDCPQLSGIIINPFGQPLVLRREQLAEIHSETMGMTLERTEHKQPQIIEALTAYPVGLGQALCERLRKMPQVSRAWIVSARPGIGLPTHKLFALEFKGDRKGIFPHVASAVKPFMCPGESFELMKAEGDFLRTVEEKANPVYVKKIVVS